MGEAAPTARAHAYGLVRTILSDAVQRRLIDLNPCHIRGAGNTKRVKRSSPRPSPSWPHWWRGLPKRYQLMALLAAWCGLRFGELAELRRGDIDLKAGVVHVRRAVVRVNGEVVVSTPKSEAGVRDVAIPPHLREVVREHMAADITGGRDGLLFPAAEGVSHMAPSTLYKVFHRARASAGPPDLRSTTCGTPVRSWQRKRVRRWRADEPAGVTPLPAPRCAISTLRPTGT